MGFCSGVVLCCLASLLLVLMLIFINVEANAHSAEETTVGINEHLGAKIPLDIIFRDERGRPVRLAELVTGPTVILPVYFSCTNVCYNLQWGLAQVLPRIKSKPGDDYRIISISFDEDGWRFLTGDPASIKKFTEAVGFAFFAAMHYWLPKFYGRRTDCNAWSVRLYRLT